MHSCGVSTTVTPSPGVLSILYLRCRFGVEPRVLVVAGGLSILYLRCSTNAACGCTRCCQTSFNSLFEMLIFKKGKIWRERCSFNSLFEMLPQKESVALTQDVVLSILYLRCRRPICRHAHIDTSRCSFNSLFEMPTAPLARRITHTCSTFNSLFEMHHRGGRGREDEHSHGYLSILYLRCLRQSCPNTSSMILVFFQFSI